MTTTTFAEEILAGLRSSPKQLSSKWFYDEVGDKLFQAIMAMPEYYLTDAEREIFQSAGPELLAAIGGRPFDLIELGAGDGSKTQYLIEQFLAAKSDFVYRPIDISAHAISILGELIKTRWPLLPFQPIQNDYFSALDRLGSSGGDRLRLVLFPGANIGNFSPEEARGFLRHLRGFLRPGDLVLIGFDLKKDPEIILAAYNDPAGHTAAFNLNLLERINRELGADFKSDNWRHWETYNPRTGAARSFLVAEGAQTVEIADLEETIVFEPYEAIAVEISQKYSRNEISELAEASGFELLDNLEDEKGWFADSLWRVGE
ncbi:L-histidine N(alpha)-methyltransferase [Neolewinella agarilytica]|uniref:Dimethylhistidine N-methyltransferase n=1 Tax=Neolewinella agarilytica TaxID=478744 RepID=A0A1H9DS18_9BACT|nr:L-histidine N(alpha)-methyltransferase [Neolewinella agarilytica]SEQ16280.1 dimethylhistidine N-methyltransferase [Neolewinella agarilytica]